MAYECACSENVYCMHVTKYQQQFARICAGKNNNNNNTSATKQKRTFEKYLKLSVVPTKAATIKRNVFKFVCVSVFHMCVCVHIYIYV